MALAMVLFEPAGTPRAPLLGLLFAYCAWALAVLRRLLGPAAARASTSGGVAESGIDMACFGLLIALSGGWESRFAPFMLFPVAVVAFQDGLRRAVGLGLLGTALFAAIGAAVAWPHAAVQDFPGGAALLLALGTLIVARWGQAEATHLRRLAFSNELHRVFHPRNTLKDALHALADTVRLDLGADSCMIVMQDPDAAGWLLYLADGKPASGGSRGEPLDEGLAQSLLATPAEDAVLFSRHRWPLRGATIKACDWATLQARTARPTDAAQLANLLEASAFLSLPLRLRAQSLGRIHVIRRRMRYTLADLRVVAQMAGEAWPMLESMRLADRLALQVAAAERRRISRDLHDGTIQPYIGLKLGLEALRRRLSGADTIASEVDELINMAGDGIVQLRRYVGSLKGRAQLAQGGLLLPAVRQQVEKFTEYYGIAARVVGDADLAVRGELHDDVINIVREGLSNIRRHTGAAQATVTLEAAAGRLVVEIINDLGAGPTPAEFFPRSIGERAQDRGGRISVQRRSGGWTAVAVELPL